MPSEIVDIPAPTAVEHAPRHSPTGLVACEFVRLAGAALLLPLRVLGHSLRRDELEAQVRDDLSSEPEFVALDGELRLPGRPLRIFISCAEASGETHACNFIDALRGAVAEAGAPPPELVGLGGGGLAGRDVRMVGDPVSQARMGLKGILGALPFYTGLARSAAAELSGGAVDLFVGVDSPALHVPLAHIARRCQVPTVQYITPQYWGWAPWRVEEFRNVVDLALSILPFEPAWFARHQVQVAHVGHPLLDELDQSADIPHEETEGRRTLVVLPGSRRSVIARNLPLMLAALEPMTQLQQGWRVRICQRDSLHRDLIEECIRRCALAPRQIEFSKNLQDELAGADAALSVSGTILINLLHQRIPTVVLYALESRMQEWMGRHFLTVPWFSSVNLLAGSEVYPEFSFTGTRAPEELLAALERLLGDGAWRAECRAGLELARKRLGPAGASRRAALAALGIIDQNPR